MEDALHIRPVKTDGRSSAAASSRAAANLSMERLYRKRAIDRENQRVLRQKNKARLAELEAEVSTLTARLEQAEADKALAAATTQTSSTSLDGIIASLQTLQVSLAKATTAVGGGTRGGVGVAAVDRTPGSSPSASASPMASASASSMTSMTNATSTEASSLSPSPASLHSDSTTTKGGGQHHAADQVMGGMEGGQQQQQPCTAASETVTLNLDNLDFWGSGTSVTVPVDDGIPFQNSDFSLDIDLLTRSLPLFSADLLDNCHPGHNEGRHADNPQSPASPTQLHPHLYPQYQQQQQHSLPEYPQPYHLHHKPPGGIDFQAPSPPPPSAAGDSLRRNPHDDTGAVYLARAEANRLRDASPIWATTPAYVPPTSNVDELIINLVYKRRRGREGSGASTATAATAATTTTSATSATTASTTPPTTTDEFTNANFPSVSSLLNPVLYEPDKPVASTIARHVAGIVMVYTTPEKAALLYMMCIYIRWLIAPTRDHYDSIPEFFRPTGAQLVVPHPFWIDTLGWPRARERMVRHFDHTRYRDFASIIVKSFSIGWPHSGNTGSGNTGSTANTLEGILEGSPDKGYVMTRAFVQHVRQPANWTVGPELVEAFPFLEGAMNVRGRPPVSF